MSAPQANRHPLSLAQHGIWIGHELSRDRAAFNAAEYIVLRGELDQALLLQAIRAGLSETEALHVRLGADERGPFQQLTAAGSPVVDLVKVGSLTGALAWMQREVSSPVSLTRDPLYRHALLQTGPDEHVWYQRAHHVCLDGYGFALLQQRVAERYSSAVREAVPRLRPLPRLEEVIARDVAYRGSSAQAADAEFWRARLGDLAPAQRSDARSHGSYPAAVSEAHERTLLPARLIQALSQALRPQGVHWSYAVTAAIALQLAEQGDSRESTLGLPVLGRHDAAAMRLPCMLMNIVALRVPLQRDESFAALAARISAELAAVRPHARFRYEDLPALLGSPGLRRSVFRGVVNILPFARAAAFAGLQATRHSLRAGPVEDLAFSLGPAADGGGACLELEAHPALYDAAQLQARLQAVREQLLQLAADPQRPLSSLLPAPPSRATPAPRDRRIPPASLHGPVLREPAQDCVARIWLHAQRRPDALAVSAPGCALTYAALARDIRRVRAKLVGSGVRPGDMVSLLLPRTPQTIAIMLGVLDVGAAYLPLDVDGPSLRNQAIIDDASPRWHLTTRERARELALARTTCLVCDAWDAPDPNPEAQTPPPDAGPAADTQAAAAALAYVIYTSGSTGTPNGVCVSRGALAHFVAAAVQRYGIEPDDRVLQFAVLHFDASVEEVFATLYAGASLVLRDAQSSQSVPALLRACRAQGIRVLPLPTALFHELAHHLASRPRSLPACVRLVIIGGEAVLGERVRAFRAAVDPEVRLCNTYGPTETTVVATTAELAGRWTVGGDLHEVPIGRPLPGLSAHVVDAALRPVARGESGELCLAGPTLARGYLRRPSLEAQRFVVLPATGERVYRTGDRVRMRADDQLIFEGRLDDELKLSGQRVHLVEVESALLSHPDVQSVSAFAWSAAAGATRLAAAVVPADPRLLHEPGRSGLITSLTAHAAARLLTAAVPQAWLVLPRLLYTSRGKLDRAELAARLQRRMEAAPAPVYAGRAQRVAALWQELLQLPHVQPQDDFFACGGRSLQAIQLASRLSLELGREVSASLLFEYPRFEQLVAALEGTPPQGAQTLRELDDPAELLGDIQPSWREPVSRAAGPIECCLLTGVTGFVGRHVLRELLASERPGQVVCLVRADSAKAAHARLQQVLDSLALSPAQRRRVEPLCGDLGQPQLGLGADAFAQLAQTCDGVIHAGAGVSLLQTYQSLRATNVLGTREIVRLACTGRRKRLLHLSSLAVGVGSDPTGRLPERFLPEHAGLRDGYQRSKWLAERLVQLALQRGVCASVVRLGRVTGARQRELTRVNTQDIVFRLLRLGLSRGVLPRLRVCEPWTAVDDVARFVCALARAPRSQELPPLLNFAPAQPVELEAFVARLVARGYALRRCEPQAWLAQVGDARTEDEAASLSLFAQHGSVAASSLEYERTAAAALCAALGVPEPSIDGALLDAYIDVAIASGALPKPQA